MRSIGLVLVVLGAVLALSGLLVGGAAGHSGEGAMKTLAKGAQRVATLSDDEIQRLWSDFNPGHSGEKSAFVETKLAVGWLRDQQWRVSTLFLLTVGAGLVIALLGIGVAFLGPPYLDVAEARSS